MQQKSITGLLIVLFLCFAQQTPATSRFGHLTIKDGLSQSTVKSIVQDSRGYMWFGSADGLNRYDGYKLTVYRNDPSNALSISGNDIPCIYENSTDSTLWIGTQGEGLNLYDRKHDAFVSFRHDSKSPTTLPANDVRSILNGPDGNLWIGTKGGGICRFNPTDSSFFQPGFSLLHQFSVIHSMVTDNKGGLWLGTESGLYRYDVKSGMTPAAVNPGVESPVVLSLLYDVKGNLWIGTRNQGLIKYQPETGKIRQYKSDGNNINSTTPNQINAVHQRKNGSVWIAAGNGLFHYDAQHDDFESFVNDPNDPESINDEVFYSLCEDRSGIFWTGTFLGGVNKLEPEDSRFRKYNNFFRTNRLNKALNNVKGICRDQTNTLWVATSKGLIALKPGFLENPSDATRIRLYFEGVDQNNIFCDSHNNVYSSNLHGLYLLKSGSSEFELFKPSNLPVDIRVNQFNAGFEDSEGTIWVATYTGLLKYDPKRNTVSLTNPKNPQGVVTRKNFLSLTESFNGKFWLGTVDGFLYEYDPNIDTFNQVMPVEASGNRSTFNRIFSVCEQAPGIIWFGTNNGLYEYLTKEKRLNRYMSSDGLANNVVYSVIPDEQGRIWCSTNLGISVFNSRTRTFQNYTWEDGLQSNEFNQNAGYKAHDGVIYMGGIDGFNVIDPARIVPNQFIPPVVFTAFTVNRHLVTPFSNPEITTRQIGETKAITLSHNQSIFTFEFAALNFILSGKNKYRYQLEGYDKDWVDAGAQRTASYTNIDPGTYTFLVKGSNNDGVWNEQPAKVKITIKPPFWLTWWFKSGIILFLSLVVYFVFYIRIRTIKKERELLGKLVEEKTADLSEKSNRIKLQNEDLVRSNEEIVSRNEKIEQKNRMLNEQNEKIVLQRDNLLALAEQMQEANQAKINFFTTISHEFRTPLTLIIGPLKELITNVDELNKKELQRKFKIIYGNASRLLLLVNQLLDFRKADTNREHLNRSRIDIIPYIKQIAFLFNDNAQRKKIQFRFLSAQRSLMVSVDAEKLEKIVANLLSNAFKYTPEHGEITLNVDLVSGQSEGDQFRISVADSGPGISHEHLANLFDAFYQVDHARTTNYSASGLGLALVKKYVELHGGTIGVKSDSVQGTTFIFSIPIVEEEEISLVNSYFPEQMLLNSELMVATISGYSPNPIRDLKAGEEHGLPKLLLIEDDNNLRDYLKELLSEWYRVDEAADAANGLRLADLRHPDLILCDVLPDDLSGFEMCKKIKEEFKTSHIPVILLSAITDLPNQIKALKAGADAFITKPFDLEHLFLTIENLILQRRKIQAKFYHGTDIPDADHHLNQEDQKFMKKVIAAIEKNINNASFDVEFLCREINLSQPQTYRKIKAITDLSISEFIRSIRLRKAAQLLASGQLTISEVAYEVGFSDPNYFSKCFVKVYGQTPSDFIRLKN